MPARIRGLDSVNPSTVPLPPGTRVTTGVERLLGDARVPQGAVGRVVKVSGGQVDVAIMGLGVVRYAREELTPLLAGELRFALRREAAWQALQPATVLEATVGSRAWGLADAGSDIDRRGIFVLPFPWTGGLVEPPHELVSADGSATYWEVGKALRQALRNDPNTLELLFVDGVAARDPIGQWILDARDAFPSAEIYKSFGRYALSQLHKLRQDLRLREHRALLLEWLRAEPGLDLDAVAARLAQAVGIVAPTPAEARLRAKQYVKQVYGSLFDQRLVAARTFEALRAFAATEHVALALPRELRPKNAYNLVRLLATATEWLRTGQPRLAVQGALRDELLAIKHGEVALPEVLARADALGQGLEQARQACVLPARPDLPRVHALLTRIRAEVARRWLEQRPGAFGAGAPAAPEPGFEE